MVRGVVPVATAVLGLTVVAAGAWLWRGSAGRNAVSSEMWDQLAEAAEDVAQDESVRVVVMRGSGETAFVSGADISEFESREQPARQRGTANAIVNLATLQKPLLCLIHGFCVGGGVAIALTADLRYASEDAEFGIPAARLGLGYPMAGFENLVQLIGLSNAKEIFLTAGRFSAESRSAQLSVAAALSRVAPSTASTKGGASGPSGRAW